VKPYVNKMIREPLVHFLLIGAGLFLLFGLRGNPTSVPGSQSGSPSSRIVVTRGDIDQLITMFKKTWQRPPTGTEVKGLVENFVREEIYYREALAIGLDRDDTVIRRRMRQKMEFIFEDVAAQVEPTDNDLHAFMKTHPERYLVDPQVSFRQVYINVDKRGKNAAADARQILAQLNGGTDPDSLGDTFLLEPDTRLLSLGEIRKQFGEAFGRSLLELHQGRWEGPVRSGYGLHLIFVVKRVGGRLPKLNEMREIVQRDWTVEQKKKLKEAAYARLRARYSVEFEKVEDRAIAGVADPGTRAVR
jgi:hypothetical protein